MSGDEQPTDWQRRMEALGHWTVTTIPAADVEQVARIQEDRPFALAIFGRQTITAARLAEIVPNPFAGDP